MSPYNKTNDLMLMQAACSILEDPGIILASLLDRLNLTVWATSAVEDSRLPEESFELADEFLLLTIAILSERMFTDVSEVHSKVYRVSSRFKKDFGSG